MHDRMRWTAHIKALRAKHGVSLDEAHLLASRQPEWRRWVERQVNSDPRCRQMALRHIRHLGRGALLFEAGEMLRVR